MPTIVVIDDDAGTLVDGLVNPVNDLVFGIRLVKFDRTAGRSVAAHDLNLSQCGGAVDLGFALAEAVQVRSVEYVNRFSHVQFPLNKVPQP